MVSRYVTACATRLRQARTRLGLSQAALARAAGVTQSAIANYEQAERYPDPVRAVALARALEVSASHLLGLDDESTLTDPERELLESYRATDDRGRAAIHAIARSQITKRD